MKGFTLIELLVAIVIAAILLIFAAPAFKNMLMDNRIMAKKDAFIGALNYARNTALATNTNVVVCPITTVNSTTCGGNWNSGWIVATQPATGTARLLEAITSGSNDPTLSAVTLGTNAITFDPKGIATTNGNFTICDTRGGQYAESLEVLQTGFVQSGQTTGSTAWDGTPIACP